MDPNEPEPIAESPEPSSLVGRLANVIAAPGEAFDQIKDRPVVNAHWLVPVLLTVVLAWISVAVIFSQDFPMRQIQEIQEQAIQKQIETGKMTKQQADQAKQAMEKVQGITAVATKVMAFVGPPFGTALSLFAWALVLWLGGKVLKSAEVSNGPPYAAVENAFGYMKAVEVVGLAMMVDALGVVVKTLLILVKGSLFATPSLALLVEFNPSNHVHTVLAMFNVMVIWSLAVMSVGFARLTRLTFLKAAGWVFGIWVAFTGALIGGGLLFAAIMERITHR